MVKSKKVGTSPKAKYSPWLPSTPNNNVERFISTFCCELKLVILDAEKEQALEKYLNSSNKNVIITEAAIKNVLDFVLANIETSGKAFASSVVNSRVMNCKGLNELLSNTRFDFEYLVYISSLDCTDNEVTRLKALLDNKKLDNKIYEFEVLNTLNKTLINSFSKRICASEYKNLKLDFCKITSFFNLAEDLIKTYNRIKPNAKIENLSKLGFNDVKTLETKLFRNINQNLDEIINAITTSPPKTYYFFGAQGIGKTFFLFNIASKAFDVSIATYYFDLTEEKFNEDTLKRKQEALDYPIGNSFLILLDNYTNQDITHLNDAVFSSYNIIITGQKPDITLNQNNIQKSKIELVNPPAEYITTNFEWDMYEEIKNQEIKNKYPLLNVYLTKKYDINDETKFILGKIALELIINKVSTVSGLNQVGLGYEKIQIIKDKKISEVISFSEDGLDEVNFKYDIFKTFLATFYLKSSSNEKINYYLENNLNFKDKSFQEVMCMLAEVLYLTKERLLLSNDILLERIMNHLNTSGRKRSSELEYLFYVTSKTTRASLKNYRARYLYNNTKYAEAIKVFFDVVNSDSNKDIEYFDAINMIGTSLNALCLYDQAISILKIAINEIQSLIIDYNFKIKYSHLLGTLGMNFLDKAELSEDKLTILKDAYNCYRLKLELSEEINKENQTKSNESSILRNKNDLLGYLCVSYKLLKNNKTLVEIIELLAEIKSNKDKKLINTSAWIFVIYYLTHLLSDKKLEYNLKAFIIEEVNIILKNEELLNDINLYHPICKLSINFVKYHSSVPNKETILDYVMIKGSNYESFYASLLSDFKYEKSKELYTLLENDIKTSIKYLEALIVYKTNFSKVNTYFYKNTLEILQKNKLFEEKFKETNSSNNSNVEQIEYYFHHLF